MKKRQKRQGLNAAKGSKRDDNVSYSLKGGGKFDLSDVPELVEAKKEVVDIDDRKLR